MDFITQIRSFGTLHCPGGRVRHVGHDNFRHRGSDGPHNSGVRGKLGDERWGLLQWLARQFRNDRGGFQFGDLGIGREFGKEHGFSCRQLCGGLNGRFISDDSLVARDGLFWSRRIARGLALGGAWVAGMGCLQGRRKILEMIDHLVQLFVIRL